MSEVIKYNGKKVRLSNDDKNVLYNELSKRNLSSRLDHVFNTVLITLISTLCLLPLIIKASNIGGFFSYFFWWYFDVCYLLNFLVWFVLFIVNDIFKKKKHGKNCFTYKEVKK